MMGFGLTGKVAIITGASKGIGRAIGLAFADAGAKVVVSSRKQEAVDAVAAQITERGGEALAIQAHVGQPEAVAALVQRTMDSFGRVDIAVNNAATNPHFGPLLTADEGQWDKILDVNLKGCFRLCQQVVPIMREQGGGKIINLASAAGITPSPLMGIYSISKAGVILLTKVLAQELGPHNIQVNAIAPGVIRTKFSRVLWEAEQIAEPILARLPLGRFGEAKDVVGAALYLASPASDYVTGVVIVVDGGMSVASGIG